MVGTRLIYEIVCTRFKNMQVVEIVEKLHTQNSFDFYPKSVMFVLTNPGVVLSTTSEALDRQVS